MERSDAQRWLRRRIGNLVKLSLWLCLGGRVREGPFAGMRYVRNAVSSAYPPKILGTYEQELNPVWERWQASPPRRILDIGSAEGYYAVGLARYFGCPVDAFETEPEGRRLLARNAALNGLTESVTQLETATPELLEAHIRGLDDLQPGEVLIVCDIEGGEDSVLDPERIPALADCRLVVELHEFILPGVGARLRERFRPTHDAEEIPTVPRRSEDFPVSFPAAALLPARLRRRLVDEQRPAPMSWLVLTPRSERVRPA